MEETRTGPRQMTTLHRAVWAGDSAAALQHIREGSDVNAKDNGGYTPLHWAADMGANAGDRVPIAKALIAAGADVNAKDVDGYTPLATARFAEAEAIVEVLVANGATE
jgi:ankyrin repeat protein